MRWHADEPVISADCPNGPTEILNNAKWGRLVPVVGAADALAQSMLVHLRIQLIICTEGLDFSVDKAGGAHMSLLLADGKNMAE